MKVLIVDDQAAVLTALRLLFEVNGLEVLEARDPSTVLRLLREEEIGVVVQDMNFTQAESSGSEGAALFEKIRALDPDVPVLLMTAWASLAAAVKMVKAGATDYFAKPWDDEKLLRSVRNLLRLRQLEWENTRLRAAGARSREQLARRAELKGLDYVSAAMHEVVSLAVSVAPSDAPVLILGPNGSGKEKLAEIIQANSRRQRAPFIRVNAGGLAESLLEAELFGAEAGAFTGATKLRVGRFEAAHGGTLFLDEIGNLSAGGQARLLRVLQTGEFERVGSSTTRKVDVRILSATNSNLKQRIAEGSFREDLYFRLNVIELKVPPLSQRADDVLPLARRFLLERGGGELTAAAVQALLQHDWPGNVRELQNRVHRASVVAAGKPVTPEALDLVAAPMPAPNVEPPPEADDPERAAITEALARSQGVVAKAAADLGLSRQALYRKMARFGLTLERRLA